METIKIVKTFLKNCDICKKYKYGNHKGTKSEKLYCFECSIKSKNVVIPCVCNTYLGKCGICGQYPRYSKHKVKSTGEYCCMTCYESKK